MSARQKTKGKCIFCGGEFGKSGMAKHLQACDKRGDAVKKSKAGQTDTFLIKVEGRYNPEYWLFLEVKTNARLGYLDSFLRDIWLECCGHLSNFQIKGVNYGIDPYDELGFESMDISVGEVINAGIEFYHRYDFGSMTELALEVIAEQPGGKEGEPVKLLARNNPPQIDCRSCGKPATWICVECLWVDEDAFFCDKCSDLHECDSEMYLPVVNSPRTGVCGYTGD